MFVRRLMGLLLGCAALVTVPVTYSAETDDEGGSKDGREEARKLVQYVYSEKMNQRMIDKTVEQMMKSRPGLRSARPEVEEYFNRIMDHKELSQLMVETYSREFTASELKKMTDFYKTDVGRKAIRKMPTIMQDANRWVMQKLSENRDELRDIMRNAKQKGK